MNRGRIYHVDNEEHNQIAEINIIPLVDIMLVLLIVFMVAAPLSITGINIKLPHSKVSAKSIDESRVILTINDSGDFYIDKLKIEHPLLTQKLTQIFKNKQNKNIYIRADKSVNYGKVIDAMSAAKLSGVQKISMLTKTEEISL